MTWQLVTLLGAVALDLALGEPPTRFHPVGWMGHYIALTAGRKPRGRPARQLIRGAALVLVGILLFGLPWLVAERSGLPLRWLWAIPVLKVTFSIRALFAAGKRVQLALQKGDLPAARELVGFHLVSRETSSLPPSLVAAATIESLAENITDSITAPLCYYALGGLALAWAYRFANTCDAMIGYRDARHEYLGKFAARLDDALNYFPARLTALFICLAAALSREDAGGSLRTTLAQHRRTASPNAGWTMAAMAGALGVTLEKLGHYRLEGGSRAPQPEDITRCFAIMRWAVAMAIAFSCMLLCLRAACHGYLP